VSGERRYDIVIVGAGTAGMAAAITAGQRGGRVAVICVSDRRACNVPSTKAGR
jgi:succinate dehydrogenase/fumarate reductase flavoprotein subunit